MNALKIKGVIFSAMLGMASVANAGVVFNNGPAAGDSGRCAETSGVCGGQWTVFDEFTLTTATTISAVGWAAIPYGGLQDLLGENAWIYSADPVQGGGVLLDTIAEQSNTPTADANLNGAYDVLLDNLSITLPAGTYWLGMQNVTTSHYATVAATSSPNLPGATQWQNNGQGARYTEIAPLAFSVYGTAAVPEPKSLALLGLGFIAMFSLRRKNQKNS